MSKHPMARPKSAKSPNDGTEVQSALELIRTQRTMVLSTSLDHAPWAAPVYYVYHPPGFYFFSSPSARHIAQAQDDRRTAASIFHDSDAWEQIQGLQMTGTIQAITRPGEQIQALGRFLAKFPMARPFLQTTDNTPAAEPNVRDKVRLYLFRPDTVFYMNNRFGFGRRVSVTLP